MSEPEGKPRPRWRRLLLEVGAIFVGITASFLVDEWREERQDTATFHRILGEIYFDIIRDESFLTGAAATNNQWLLYASELALGDAADAEGGASLEEDPGALFAALDAVFTPNQMTPLMGGFTRLSNTALNIPVNDIQLSLDDLYGLLLGIDDDYDRLAAELSDLRQEHWARRGVIPCDDFTEVLDLVFELQEALDTRGQMAPVQEAIYRGGDCRSRPINEAIALEAMGDESFRTALRTAIRIRRDMGADLAWQRGVALQIRLQLEDYLPDISLPTDMVGIIGSATAGLWDPTQAIPMRRRGPNDWEVDLSLGEGEVKFLANYDWTMNWGAPRPWVASTAGYAAGQVSLADAFPAGKAWFNGLNIPVLEGRYRVRFNTQSGEYGFESLEP